jgi:hypothetical protein
MAFSIVFPAGLLKSWSMAQNKNFTKIYPKKSAKGKSQSCTRGGAVGMLGSKQSYRSISA